MAALALTNFQLRRQRDGAVWRVTCGSGCRYSRATVTCEGDCEVIITSDGVQTRRDERLASAKFASAIREHGESAVGLAAKP